MAEVDSRSIPAVDAAAKTATNAEPSLPKLTPAEFRIYNHMADSMNWFHDDFRQSWNILYSAASSGKRPAGMSIRQYIATGEKFCHHLERHHMMEEVHIFPLLAKKMPAFRKELELLTQHKQIHAGLEKLEAYLADCKSGERVLRMEEVREVMDGFGAVLWAHLDDEVKQLEAENMRKYWSLQEMQALPM